VLITLVYSYGITLWDWAKLLLVPAVIAAGGVWFNQQQRNREMDIEDQRAQDTALQAYLEQMSRLLLEKDLRNSQEGDEVRTLARTQTLTVLGRVRDLQVIPGQVDQAHVQPKDTVIRGRVGPSRKRAIVQFLYEGHLIQKDQPIISLQGADLSGAYLSRANLADADLNQTIMVGADLSAARLNDAYLRWANLLGADLRHAVLEGADLRGTALVGAYLSAVTLSNADLSGANLSNADLRYADLSGAKGITNEQLSEAASLDGAAMPDGQIFEDWLKSKGRGEDGENGGPS
jgi:hypothetical protein